MAADPTLKQVLAQRHPLYDEFSADWQFFLDSYLGGTNYTRGGSYLFSHDREDPKRFAARLNRAVFNNYTRKVVDIYKSFIYRQPILRTSDDEKINLFLSDADRQGHSFDRVMSESVAKLAFTMGHVVVLVDLNKRTEGDALSRADEQDKQISPYISVYAPTNVMDWSLNADGSYRWIRLQEPAPDTSNPYTVRGKAGPRYRIWTESDWRLYDEDGVQVDGGPNTIGRVPAERIAPLDHPVKSELGLSIVSDIAPLNRSIYNYRSLLDEFLYLQCFNVMAIPIPGDPKAVDTVKKLVSTLGTSTGVFFDPTKGGAPSYLSPPMPPADFLLRMIESSAKEIIDLAKLQDRSASAKGESGMARAYEFIEAEAVFSSIARNLEDGERRILNLVNLWGDDSSTIDTVPVTTEYPDSFSVTDFNQEIENTLSLLTMDISDTFNQKLKEQIVKQALPSLEDADEETIFAEIAAKVGQGGLLVKEIQTHLKDAEATR